MTPFTTALRARTLAAGLTLAFVASIALVTAVSAANAPVFTTQPGGAVVGLAFSQQPVVKIQDGGITDTSVNTGTITLAKTSGTGNFTCPTNPVNIASGVANFAGCMFDAVGLKTITATWSAGGSVLSSSFLVSSGTPTKLAFTAQPTSGTGGSPLAPQPIVQVQDAAGNLAVQDNSTVVTLAIAANPGSGTLTCTGGNSRTVSGGIATFSGCSIDKIGTGYTLTATSAPVLTPATTAAFNVTVGAGTQLVFTTQPSVATTVATAFANQPVVTIRDAGGNTVTTGADSTASVTLSITSGTPTAGGPGALACTTNPVAASAGIATFAGCRIDTTGLGYKLHAAATLNSVAVTADSASFNIVSGTATKLTVCWGTAVVCNTTPPSPNLGGATLATQPTVRVQDVNGNTVVTDNTTIVTLGILAGTPTSGGPGTLTCTSNAVTVVAGVATFAGCKIDKAGVGYRLNATSSPVLAAGQSSAFNVTVGPPVKLGFVVGPPASASANANFPADIQVAIQDAGGNTVTTGITATINLAIGVNPASGVLTCANTNATTTNGVATFQSCRINAQGNGYTLVATPTATAPVTALTPATSSPFNVLAPLSAITISAPAVITWGADMTITVHFGVNGDSKPFKLQVSKDGVTWSDIAGASLTTSGAGDASFIYGPSDNRYYRAAFAGTPDLQAGFSNVVRTVVRQTNSLRPTHTGYQTISHGTQIEFKSTVRPNRPELPQPIVNFVAYQLKGGSWVKVLDRMVPTDRNPASAGYGKATLQITFNTSGKFYVRSQAVPTVLNANSGWTAPVRYAVD